MTNQSTEIIPKIDITSISTCDDLVTLLSKSAYRHTFYYHYSDISGINGILDSQTLWASSMLSSNDNKEHTCFGENTYTYFQFCFSCGTTENLPLWFLYSGRNGNGARIAFSGKDIYSWIDPSKMELTLVKKETNKKVSLIPGENCTVDFRDILYVEREHLKCRLKHSGKTNNNVAFEIADKYRREHPGFIKDIIWFYEKETRLLIKVNEDLLDKPLLDNQKNSLYHVELKIPDTIFRKINLTLSPQYDNHNLHLTDKILNQAGFKKLFAQKAFSRYAGQINIDLCRKCDKCDTCFK